MRRAKKFYSEVFEWEFEDYPMPADYPDFPSHRQLRAYFDSYAAHFGVEPFVRLRLDLTRNEVDSQLSQNFPHR